MTARFAACCLLLALAAACLPATDVAAHAQWSPTHNNRCLKLTLTGGGGDTVPLTGTGI